MKREGRFKLERVSVRLVKDAPLYSDHRINCAKDAIQVVNEMISDCDRELMCVINLRTDGTPINCSIVSMGTLNRTLAHPRELLKSSILSNADRMIMVHNHPSNHAVPSGMDVEITDRMLKLTALIQIPLLDHIIVGTDPSRYFSFREQEMITVASDHYETDYRQLSFSDIVSVAEPGRVR